MTSESDEQLFLEGEAGAMARLIARYERPLLGFLQKMTQDRHTAEDCFQETFLRLHRARGSFDPARPLKPYLYRIAHNVARDARQPKTAAPDRDGRLDPHPGPQAGAAANEARAAVRDAVDALPRRERIVVWLRMYEGLTFREIAEITGVALPTAKSRMVYALRRLRPVLEQLVRPRKRETT